MKRQKPAQRTEAARPATNDTKGGSEGVERNGKATGGVTGKGFMPGQSGNPGGMKKMPEDLKAALAADSLALYEKAKALYEKALRKGSLQVAATLIIALLKKTIPDAQTLLISGPEGGPVQVTRLDPKKLTREQLDAVLAAVKAQGL